MLGVIAQTWTLMGNMKLKPVDLASALLKVEGVEARSNVGDLQYHINNLGQLYSGTAEPAGARRRRCSREQGAATSGIKLRGEHIDTGTVVSTLWCPVWAPR